jgi:hypothetical protein
VASVGRERGNWRATNIAIDARDHAVDLMLSSLLAAATGDLAWSEPLMADVRFLNI